MVFPESTLGDAQAPWLSLLETKVLPEREPQEDPGEWMIQSEWEQRLAGYETTWERRMAQFRTEIHQEIVTLRGDFRSEISALRTELIKWMFLFWVGTVLTLMRMTAA